MAATALCLPSSVLVPIPSTKCKEIPLWKATRLHGVEHLIAPTATEIDKQRGFGALGDAYTYAQLPSDAVCVFSHVLYKLKSDDRFTCRVAACGDRLPAKPTSETFASVISDHAKLLSVALMQAHCASRSEVLHISDADVVGGFLHIPSLLLPTISLSVLLCWMHLRLDLVP